MQDLFLELYNKLNKAQKQAVDTIEGPVMVIAGPGTGKTSILTLRIANIIKKTDTSPENILALTFTDSGAYAMRKKLVSIIGTAGYKVNINTFHGFCNEIIKQYPERFPRIIGSTAITDIDQISIMEKIIESSELKMLKPYGDVFYYVKPALSEIKSLKREALSVDDFRKSIEKQERDFDGNDEKIHIKGAHKGKMKGEFLKLKEQIEKNKELLKLYEQYEKSLLKEKYYDFEDMIVEVVKTLKSDEDLLLIIQETYQYILADEHQDANNSQNAILELLSNFHKNPNLFIVGDEKQAIYRFQGASLENFFKFKNLYPEAKLINLEDNYRSTQSILDASHSLIENNTNSNSYKRIALQAKAEKGKEPVHIFECSSVSDELDFVVEDIKSKISSGIDANEIAILYRDNKDAFPMTKMLEKTDIPFRVESDNDILKDENIRKILLILESIHDLSNDEKLSKVLFIDFFKLNAIDIYKLFEQVRKEKAKLIDATFFAFPDITNKLSTWASASHNKTFLELFEIVIRESGYLEFVLSSADSLDRMGTLEAFFGELKKLIGSKGEYYLTDFIDHLNRVREHGILTKIGKDLNIKSGVRLMTAHKSKGLEFDVVYIINSYDGHWSNKTKRKLFRTTVSGSDNTIDDERRLFYVAITRARKYVAITYAKEGNDGKEQLPTQFISEILDDHKKFEEVKSNKKQSTIFSESITHLNHEIKNKKYLQDLFLEQGLAVTALNNYLKCPWEYFFINLIRLPRAQSKHQMYGTAIHETLRTFFDKYKVEQDMSEEDLLTLFEFNLRRTLLSPADLADTIVKGKDALKAYYDQYKGLWSRNLITEYSIRGVHFNVGKFDLVLKGQLDKVEFYNENEVNVVDYKTGKKKSTNKDNYQRQLVFYKLLLELDEKKKYIMKSGELDFIESKKKERFDITENDVLELKKLITEKANEIFSLAFWDKKCDDKSCEYCELSKSLVSEE
jgi:DNA helicase-2/ATP-dependent DNA helicase PcrA